MVKVSEGNEEAYERLYEKYIPILTSYFINLNSHKTLIKDLVQETFTRIWEKREEYRPTATFKTFLFGYAKNVLKENIASAIKEITLDADELSDLIAKPSKFEVISQNKDIIAYLEIYNIHLTNIITIN